MNEAMGTVVGELIQMNAKMVVAGDAKTCMVIGLLGCVTFVLWTLWAAMKKRKILAIVFVVLALAEVALFAHGVTTPREKIIHACVNGPISLETVSAVYDIVKIDGKELVLRER